VGYIEGRNVFERGLLVKFAFLLLLPVLAGAADLEQARALYERTDFEQSLKVLKEIPQKDGPVYALMGRDYFMTGDYKKAVEALEKAVAADPRNSDYALWLGRAYGRRAEMAGPLGAMGQASKARLYFERAVALDPRNMEALEDLLDYQMEAPGFLGGGMEKAKATVAQIGRVDAAEGLWAEARLDEKRKEWGSAEEHLRRAVEVAPQVGRLIDLARLLARQGRYQESDQSFARAEQMAPDRPKLLYARADVYIKSHRNLEVARELLHRYLSANLTPDDPPKSEARKLLRQIEGG
jgi:tetratricopeptide (TPR) repeat protein